MLGDKQEAKFGGVDRDESCVHFVKFSMFFIAKMHDSQSFSLKLC